MQDDGVNPTIPPCPCFHIPEFDFCELMSRGIPAEICVLVQSFVPYPSYQPYVSISHTLSFDFCGLQNNGLPAEICAHIQSFVALHRHDRERRLLLSIQDYILSTYVPLNFWFSTFHANAIPIVALQHSVFDRNINFDEFEIALQHRRKR